MMPEPSTSKSLIVPLTVAFVLVPDPLPAMGVDVEQVLPDPLPAAGVDVDEALPEPLVLGVEVEEAELVPADGVDVDEPAPEPVPVPVPALCIPIVILEPITFEARTTPCMVVAP